MKKIMILFVMVFGVAFASNAQTTLRIELPTGESRTVTIDKNIRFPCCGEVINYQTNNNTPARWSFPVYYNTPAYGTGSFTMSGTATDMCGIIYSLENIFNLNIGGCY